MQKTDYPYPLSHIQSIHEKEPQCRSLYLNFIEWFACHYHITEYNSIEMYRWLKKRRPLLPKEHQNVQELTLLTVEQTKLFNTIKNQIKQNYLIRGVTGETQIYAHLINNTIMNKQSVLMLIPEISLTPQSHIIFPLNYFSKHRRYSFLDSQSKIKKSSEPMP